MEIGTLVHTLVERKAIMQVKSVKNTLAKREKAVLLDTLVARLSEVKVEKPCESLAEVVRVRVDTLHGREKRAEVETV